MFEQADTTLPHSLGAQGVSDWKDQLARSITQPSGLDDAERIDTIRSLEELVCVATAAQAALTAELDESQRAWQASRGVPAEQQGRGMAAQVALARRESPHRGQRHLGLATIVARELPCTWVAWRAGAITEWKATLVARETACLTREDRAAVDEAVAADPDVLAQMGDRELAVACQKEAYRLDPESYVARRRKAEADRSVTLRPAPDAMTWLTALVPVKDGVAAYAALTRAADGARATGDSRSKGQVMADTLVESVLGAAAQRDDARTRWDASTDEPRPAGGPATVGVALGLVMTDRALFGTSDEAAHVENYGPVPAELAREIVAGACSAGQRVWLRRLYADPATGQLTATDSQARRFPEGLARFIRLRDQFCRTPWCDAPIRHTDHPTGVAEGGETSADNGQGLCEACNYAKQAAGWRARSTSITAGDHQVETTTPTGHHYQSRAPALTETCYPLSIDWFLAG